MKIPASLYGLYRDVNPRCRRIVTKLACGASWNNTIGADDTIDTATQAGLLVLEGSSTLLISEPHFHCYVPLYKINRAQFEGRLTA